MTVEPTAKQKSNKPIDPFEAFRGVRDAYLDSMSKMMVNAVNSEQYAQASGTLLDGCLTMAAPVREAVDKAMAPTLEQLSLPSRQQVAGLAERITNVEMRLDDIDAKLDRILGLFSANQSPSAGSIPKAKHAVSAEEPSPQDADAESGGR